MALEQQIEQLEELCHNAKQTSHARRSRRGQRRVRLYRRALEAWLDDCLGNDPSAMLSNPTECGRILYRAQGYLGLASCNGFDFVLIKSLQTLEVLVSLLSLLFLVWFVGQSPASLGDSIPLTIGVSLISLFIPVYLLWFSSIGISLPVMMGYALTRQRAPGAVQPGRKVRTQFFSLFQPFFHTCVSIPHKMWNMSHYLLRYWLRVWSVFGGALLFLALFSAIIVDSPSDVGVQGFALIAFVAVAFSLFCIPICFFITLPFTLTMQAQMWGELVHPQRSPEARRSAVRPAIKLLSFHIICFLAIALAVLNLVPPFNSPAALITSGPFSFYPLHQAVYLLGVALLYLLGLELPYRWGLRNWKNRRLDELAKRRKGVDRRLSQALSATALEKELSFIQEDYVRWQYYLTQEKDIKQTLPGPFSLVQHMGALLLTLASSYLINIATGPVIPVISNFLNKKP